MRALHTPVTMAVLGLLRERPRHPYEMRAVLRERHVREVVRLRGGSIYDAITRLERTGHITAVDTTRQGSRPERTVYALTPAGRALLDTLVRAYVGTVAVEYPVFAAGLAHLPHLPPAEAARLLSARADGLEAGALAASAALEAARERGLPRLVLLETEYALTARRAEIAWLRGLVRDIEAGDLPWITIEED
jgi:DNA-binding PadR family transcriptional regulator